LSEEPVSYSVWTPVVPPVVNLIDAALPRDERSAGPGFAGQRVQTFD